MTTTFLGEIPVQDTYSPRFTLEQLQVIGQLIDVAIKATGVQGAKLAMPIIAILEACEPDAAPLEPIEETDGAS